MAKKRSHEGKSRRQRAGKTGEGVDQRDHGVGQKATAGDRAGRLEGSGGQTPGESPALLPDMIDEAGEESFPASDPPSWTPRVRVGPPRRAQG